MGLRHRVLAMSAIALALVVAPATASTFRAERVIIVGRVVEGAPWTDAATEARAGDGAELAVVLVGREGKRRVIVADRAIASLRIGGRAVKAGERRDPA